MRGVATLLALLIIAPAISGCFGGENKVTPDEEGSFSFEQGDIPATPWYHYPGTVS